MGIEDEAAYVSLRKSLDSLRDVVLADYALFETSEEKKSFADFVTQKIIGFLQHNSEENRAMWDKAAESRAKAYTSHAQSLLEAREPSLCPPGFREEDGICVPI